MLVAITVGIVLGADLFFVLTQLWNPGVVNPHNLSESEIQKHGTKYCDKCKTTVLKTMTHCYDCKICV